MTLYHTRKHRVGEVIRCGVMDGSCQLHNMRARVTSCRVYRQDPRGTVYALRLKEVKP